MGKCLDFLLENRYPCNFMWYFPTVPESVPSVFSNHGEYLGVWFIAIIICILGSEKDFKSNLLGSGIALTSPKSVWEWK